MKSLRLILGLVMILAFSLSHAEAQAKKTKKLGSFHRNRVAFQKAKYGQTTKKYGRACSILEKKRTKGTKKPFLSFGRRKSKNRKVAEQN